MIRTFIQVLALTLSLLSAYFLIRGVVETSVKDMATLSQTFWGYNLKVAESYCHQRANYAVGFMLLLTSFILQLINTLWAMRWNDFAVNKAGVIIAIVVSLLIVVAANKASNYLYGKWYTEVETLLKSKAS